MDNFADYNGGELLITSIIFLAITYLSVFLRCFVRIWITRSFSADDWFMLLAQANFTLSCAFILRGVRYGMGHHNMALPQGERIQGLKYQALATLTYVSNMMFIKLSIAIFLLRISVKRRYIWILNISMGVVSIWSTAIIFYSIFQCTPVEAQWDFTISPQKCTSGDSFVSAAYSISILSIVSDWMYALMPIFMIRSVQMNLQNKITVGFVLSLGIFASIATIIRLKYLSELSDYSDILHTGTTAMVWTLIEPGIAIVAASLITIRPLLRAMKLHGFDSTNPSHRNRSDNLNISLRSDIPIGNFSNSVSTRQSHFKEENSINLNKKTSGTTLKGGMRGPQDAVSDDGSEEFILQGTHRDGITRTVDVTVSHDVGSSRDRSEV